MEYESQQHARTTLVSVGSAVMTDHEKAALHRDLWTELRSVPISKPEGARNGWRNFAFGAAAVVFVGVGLFGALNGFSGGDDATEDFSEVGSALGGNEAPLVADGESVQENSAENTTVAEEALDDSATGELAQMQAIAIDVQSRLASGITGYAPEPAADIADSARECVTSAGLEDYELVEGYEDQTDLLIATVTNDDSATPAVVFVDPNECVIVHQED